MDSPRLSSCVSVAALLATLVNESLHRPLLGHYPWADPESAWGPAGTADLLRASPGLPPFCWGLLRL